MASHTRPRRLWATAATIQDGFGLAELPVQRNSTLKGFSIAAPLAKRGFKDR
jgi:hypothetical protein